MPGRQISNLQGLRGLAAFLIVLYHVQPLLNQTYGQSLHSRFAVFGVDIFFVLSGFVMFYSNPTPDPGRAARFLWLRFIRIVPLYWLATLAIVAAYLVGFRPLGLHSLSPQIVAESIAFIPSTFAHGRHDLILTVGWTLMFELFFYLAFAMTFPLRSLEKSFAVLSGAFLLLSAAGQVIHPLPYLANFYTSPIMIEFLYGAALAILYLRWPQAVPAWFARTGLAMLLLGFAVSLALDLLAVPIPNKHDARFLVLGVPALLVVAGALAMERGGWILRNRALLDLGAASYALYLFHPLVLQTSVKLLQLLASTGPAVAALVAVSASLIAALLIHAWIERPILNAARKRRFTPSPVSREPPTALVHRPAE